MTANEHKPLSLDAAESFDLVLSPLVLDYVENWHAAFREFWRVLKPNGSFVFSITHPLFDADPTRTDDYFKTEAFRQADPKQYAELMRRPAFLCVRARKAV